MADSKKQIKRDVAAEFRTAIRTAAGNWNTHVSPPDSERAKITVKLVLVAVALLAAAAVLLGAVDLSPSAIAHGAADKRMLANASGGGYPVQIEGSKAVSVKAVSHGTAVLTDTAVMFLDDDGEKISSMAHYMASPVLRTAGRYTLVYDQNSLSYAVRTFSGNVVSGLTEDSIIDGAVSRSGDFVLVTNYDTAFSYVIVYSKSGKVLHRWKSTTCQITSVDISPSGAYIAVSGVTTEGGTLRSSIMVQKVGGGSNLREYTFDGTMMIAVKFTDNHRIAAVGDNLLARIHIGSDTAKTVGYEGRTLTGFDVADNGNAALVLASHSDGQNGSVAVYNTDCDCLLNMETKLHSPYIELTDNRINLMADAVFYSYTLGGKQVKKTKITADGQSIVTSGGRVLLKGIATVSEI